MRRDHGGGTLNDAPTDDPVDRVIELHLLDELLTHRRELASAADIIERGWLPDPQDAETRQHLETLRLHLRQIGQPTDDIFLLRLGLMESGIRRGVVPPLSVLRANRGGFSARRQGEAARRIESLRDALAVGRLLRDPSSSDTQQAITELAAFTRRSDAQDPVDWLDRFGALSSEQAARLADRALGLLGSEATAVRNVATLLLERLACHRRPPLGETICLALLERNILCPHSLYRDSSDVVAERLLSRIEVESVRSELIDLLLDLAWTRSAAAEDAFRHWSARPPAWTSTLRIALAAYLHYAGWCLDAHGRRQELMSSRCFRLEQEVGDIGGIVQTFTPTGETCPGCGGALCWLFDFSALDATHFQGEWATAPRRVLCCVHCSIFGPMYALYRGDGSTLWHAGNTPHKPTHTPCPEPRLRSIAAAPCSPFACAMLDLEDASTLGGIPHWVQNAVFPACIECGALMTFLAQHDNSFLHEEGIYYVFHCAPCRIAAVSYQQT